MELTRRIVLFGGGRKAEYFLYSHLHLVSNIEWVIDSNRVGKFHNIEIIPLNKFKYSGQYIIIAAGDYKTYSEMGYLLSQINLREWLDYCWDEAYEKKLVVINANCHGTGLINYLSKSNEFLNKYFVWPFDEIQNNNNLEISESLLSVADVYIHQDIRNNSSVGYKLSDEYVRKKLKKDVIDICIPNLVGFGKWLFPNLLDENKSIRSINGKIFDFVLYRDIVLDKAVLYCKTLSDYVEYYNRYTLDNNILYNKMAETKQKMYEREVHWNIKITDFFFSYFQKIPMMNDINHPSSFLFDYICRQVCDILDIEYFKEKIVLGIPSPMLPSIKECFKIQYISVPDSRKYFLGKNIEDSVVEYVRNYMWWYHEIIL